MSGDRSATRLARLVSILGEEDLDGLIVTNLPNIRYLTGFSGSAGILIVSGREVVLFTDPRYRTQVALEVDDSIHVEVITGDMWQQVWEVARENDGIKSVGYEAHHVSVHQAESFDDKTPGCHVRSTEGLVERLRLCKGPDEVRAIGDAARLATEALDRTLEQVKVALTEVEIAGLLERELRVGGSEWHPFPTIVASGPRSALPHAVTGSRELGAGEWLLLDFGAQVDGYCADISRTVIVGRSADSRQREMYELVQQAQRTARETVRAGMSGRAADALARSPIEDAGFGDAFAHSLGHGLGLEVHEQPRLSKLNEEALPPGAVVTIEPGVYFEGWGGVRLEDDVFLGEDGPVLLSDGNTELREIT